MTTKPHIAIVIGTTRQGRYADKATGWMLKQTQARDDIEMEVLDLRDHPLPFFDEKGSPMSTPSENPEALGWQKTLAHGFPIYPAARPSRRPAPRRFGAR
jgi:NAD(P)H-dependent FMN reductase